MNFKTNFNETTLFLGTEIFISFPKKLIRFKPITVADYYSDPNIDLLLSILRTDHKQMIKEVESLGFVANNHLELISGLIHFGVMPETLILGLKKIMPEIRLINGCLTIKEEPIESEEFEVLKDMILKSAGESRFEKTKKQTGAEDDELSAFRRRQKEAEERVAAAKGKKQNKEENNGQTISIVDIIIAIQQEFKFSIEDIKKMSVYTMLTYWDQVIPISHYKIKIVAAGNGLTNSFTHFTNRGE